MYIGTQAPAMGDDILHSVISDDGRKKWRLYLKRIHQPFQSLPRTGSGWRQEPAWIQSCRTAAHTCLDPRIKHDQSNLVLSQ